MPDAGDFDQGSHEQGMHADWASAFAALPVETPTADGWQRLQARLPAEAQTQQGTRWPLWLATAASLALVVAIPLRMQSTAVSESSVTVTTPASDPPPEQPLADAVVDVAPAPILSTPIETDQAIQPAPSSATNSVARKPRRVRHMDPSQQPIRTAAQPADTTLVASGSAADVPASNPDINPDINPVPPEPLESLYAQSAQLEGLLAMARDDRVSNGTAAALTDTLDAQMASIDAALAWPGMDPQDRTELWMRRVDTLQQLVGIETTQRLYAARGQQFDAALVSID